MILNAMMLINRLQHFVDADTDFKNIDGKRKLPLVEYNTNTALDEAWISISLMFNETFANEEVVFISSDSTLSLKDVLFELNPFACTEGNIITELFATLTEKEVSYTFSKLFVNGKVTNTSFVNFKNHPTENQNKIHNEDSYLAAA